MNRSRRSGGYTLIEMISVMGLMSLMMSIAVAWIVQTMRIDSVLQQRLDNHKTLLRLDQQLRDDVRLGQSMSVRENELTIEFFGQRSAVFQLQPGKLTYEVRDGTSKVREESFLFLADAAATWEISAMPKTIGLTVARVAEMGDFGPVDLHVRASIQSNRLYRPGLGVHP